MPFQENQIVEIESSLQRKYAAFIKGRRFTLETVADAQSVTLGVILKSDDESFYYPVQGRIAWREEGLSLEKAAELLLDLMDSYFQEYLVSGGETLLPLDWQDFEVNDHKMQLRGQIQNLMLEKLGDKLMAGTQE